MVWKGDVMSDFFLNDKYRVLLDEIHREQALIKPSKQIIDVFTAKIDTRIKEIWGE